MLTQVLLLASAAVRAEAEPTSELILVQSLTRHGNRAPNPTITTSCPKLYPTRADIVRTFGAEPAGLTNMGMNQMRNVGSLLRRRYIDGGFAPAAYNPHQKAYYFQARGQPRHQQSCAAMGQGLFPIGTGPVTYPDRLQPIAISSWDTGTDFTLFPPTAPCAAVMGAENAAWAASTGAALVADNLDIVRALERTCGSSIERAADPAATTKDIVDAVLFLQDEYLPPPPGLPAAMARRAVFLAQAMLTSKLFGAPDRQTMWLADFPAALLERMDCALRPGAAGVCPLRYGGYVSSRELLFVLGQTLGLAFDVPGLPPTALPPASTLTFELRQRGGGGAAAPEPFVACRLTVPPRRQADVNVTHSRALPLGACAGKLECPLSQFRAIFAALNASTGPWRSICRVRAVGADGVSAAAVTGGEGGGGAPGSSTGSAAPGASSGVSPAVVSALVCGVLGLVAGAGLGSRAAQRRGAATPASANAQDSPPLLTPAEAGRSSPADAGALQSYGSIHSTV